MIHIRKNGNVKRWHTVHTLRQQTVAEHSWGVAMICRKLWPQDSILMEAALCHDLGEGYTGDIPWPAKAANYNLNDIAGDMEIVELRRLGALVDLEPLQYKSLKIADMLELLYFVVEEMELGNRTLDNVFNLALRHLELLDKDNEAFDLIKPLVERVGAIN